STLQAALRREPVAREGVVVPIVGVKARAQIREDRAPHEREVLPAGARVLAFAGEVGPGGAPRGDVLAHEHSRGQAPKAQKRDRGEEQAGDANRVSWVDATKHVERDG